MAKKKPSFNTNTKNTANTTKIDKNRKIIDGIIQKKEQELDQDERIQKRLVELLSVEEELKVELKEEQKALEEQRQTLESEFNDLKIELHQDIEKEQLQIAEAKKKIAEAQSNLVDERFQMIESIKVQECEIQASYREELHRNWEMVIHQKVAEQTKLVEETAELKELARKEKETLLVEANQVLEKSKDEAHLIVIAAEQHKFELLGETRKKIEAKYEEITQQYEEKLEELHQKEKVLKKKQLEMELVEEDFNFMKEELASKKAFYEEKLQQLSPEQVERLQFELKSLEDVRAVDQQIIAELQKEIQYLKRLIPEDELRSVKTIIEELELVRNENNSLRDLLAQYPSEEELLHLRTLPKTIEIIEEKYLIEMKSRMDVENRIENLQIGVMELEQSKRVTETLKTVNAQLQEELNKINEVYKQTSQSKFPGLLEIDGMIANESYKYPKELNITLPELVTYLRNYGATNLKLYYSDKMIRAFLASLASSKLIILQGLSGTGKSSLPRLFKEAIDIKHSLIPVQPSWRDNRELLGYDNDFTRRFKETVFTKRVYEASAPEHQQNVYFIVLDEMNLARIEYYFADFLAVMEERPEDWLISLISNNDDLNPLNKPKYLVENGTSLMVTQNIWFIGTANRDESTFGITDKVYDRAQVINFVQREDQFTGLPVEKLSITYEQLNTLLTQPVGHSKYRLSANDWDDIQTLDVQLQKDFDITFGNRIKMQMEKFIAVYHAAGGTKLDAIDYMIAHKVLRKLEGRYESYLHDKLNELVESLDMLFGEDEMSECRKVIEQKLSRLGG